MASFRIERINKQLQREISQLLEYKIKNERARQAIITSVECSRDLNFAKVYFTTLTGEDRVEVRNALRKVSSFMRSVLAKNLHLRQVPKLAFYCDESEDYGRSIDKILDTLITETNGDIQDEADDYGER